MTVINSVWFWYKNKQLIFDQVNLVMKSLFTDSARITEYPCKKNISQFLPHSIHTNIFTIDHRSKYSAKL